MTSLSQFADFVMFFIILNPSFMFKSPTGSKFQLEILKSKQI